MERFRKLGWRWRELWRWALPPGMAPLPFESNPALRSLWGRARAGSTIPMVLALGLVGTLIFLDVAEAFARGPGTPAFSPAAPRLAAAAIFAILLAWAVAGETRWWRRDGRLDELLLTRLEREEVLQILWAPAATRIAACFLVGLIWRILWCGRWKMLWKGGAIFWLEDGAGPKNLSFALAELAVGLLLMRFSVTSVLWPAIRHDSRRRTATSAAGAGLKYLLLAGTGAVIHLAILFNAALGVEVARFGFPAARWLHLTLLAMACFFLMRQHTVDSLLDYDEALPHWIEEWRGGQ